MEEDQINQGRSPKKMRDSYISSFISISVLLIGLIVYLIASQL